MCKGEEQRRRHDNNKTFSLDNQKCEATAMAIATTPPTTTTANSTNGKGQAQATISRTVEMANAFKLFAYNMDLKCNSASNTQKMYTEKHKNI